jgi:hypothetical protein
MDDDELECRLAAGTDLATAFAAVQKPKPTKPKNRWLFDLGLLIGLAIGLLWLLH